MKFKFKDHVKRMVDSVFGTASRGPDAPPILVNRKQRRTEVAMRCKASAARRRAKWEKRGAPGRASKGRKPHRAA